MTHHSRLSSYPNLVLGTLALATAALTAGCSPQADVQAFKDTNECVTSGGYSVQECSQAFETARVQTKKLAPRYDRKEDCESDYGKDKCEGDWTGGSVPSSQVQQAASSGSTATTSHGGTAFYPYNSYYPQSSGFAYSRSKEANLSSEARVQPVFKHVSGQAHLANGTPLSYGRQTVSAHGVEVGPRASYSAGQSVSRGTASSMPHFSGRSGGSSGHSFGSTGHASGHASAGG